MVSRWIDKNIKWLFLLPTVLFILFMVAYPIIYTVRLSFFEWSMSRVDPPKFVGVENYRYLLSDGRFLMSVVHTIVFSFTALLFEAFLGITLALVLNRKFMGANIVKPLFLLPMMATPVAISQVWLLIYEPTIGVANILLEKIGLPEQAWVGSEKTAMASLILVDIWEWTPIILLIVLAGLSALPMDPYESATIDGANWWSKLWKLTIPMLSPTIIVAILLRLVDVLKTFDIIFSTTQGGPGFATETMNILGYLQGFQYFTFGRASALIVIFSSSVMLIGFLFIKIKDKVKVVY